MGSAETLHSLPCYEHYDVGSSDNRLNDLSFRLFECSFGGTQLKTSNLIMTASFIERTLNELKSLGWTVVDPIIKTLACNVVGMGAMAHVKDIVSCIEDIVTSRQRNNQPWNNAFESSNSGRSSMKNNRALPKEKACQKENEITFFEYFWTTAVFILLVFASYFLAIKIGPLIIPFLPM